MKAIAEMREHESFICYGTGYMEFGALEFALEKFSEKKRKQLRASRSHEWYISGLCACCQHTLIESAANYVFKKGAWRPCDPPRIVS